MGLDGDVLSSYNVWYSFYLYLSGVFDVNGGEVWLNGWVKMGRGEGQRESKDVGKVMQVGFVLNVHTNCACLGSNICKLLTKRRSSTFRARNSEFWASGCVVASAWAEFKTVM